MAKMQCTKREFLKSFYDYYWFYPIASFEINDSIYCVKSVNIFRVMFYLCLLWGTEARNNFCMYIWINYVWTEIQCSQLYQKESLGIESMRTFNKKSYSWTFFVRTFHKIFFFQKEKKQINYNLVRKIVFPSPSQKIFMF